MVDSAIIVIENIHRHFHDHDAKNKTVKEIAVAATNEIGNPTNLATIAIAMTFLTMFTSLFVAYVFTPYFANKLMSKDD